MLSMVRFSYVPHHLTAKTSSHCRTICLKSIAKSLPCRSSFAPTVEKNFPRMSSTRSAANFSVRPVWKPKPFSALTAVSASGGMRTPEANPHRSVRTAMTVTTQTVTAAAISSASARPITPVRATATSIRSAMTATPAVLPASQFKIITTNPSRCSAETVTASLV